MLHIHAYNSNTKELSPVSACTNSIELAKTGRQKLPVEECDPLAHLIAECNKEKDRQHEATPSQQHIML